MAIDKNGTYWKGEQFEDIAQYIREFAEYVPEIINQCECDCGSRQFTVQHEPYQGFVKLKCAECGKVSFIADSAALEGKIRPKRLRCPCRKIKFEVGVGVSLRDPSNPDGDVKWVTVGVRCAECGILGSPADWKIDYSPSGHLVEKL